MAVVGWAPWCAQRDLNFASLATSGVRIFGSKWTRQHKRLHVVLTLAINSFNAKTSDNAAIFDASWNNCLQVIACEFDIWNQDNLLFTKIRMLVLNQLVAFMSNMQMTELAVMGKACFPIMVNKKKVNMHSMVLS